MAWVFSPALQAAGRIIQLAGSRFPFKVPGSEIFPYSKKTVSHV